MPFKVNVNLEESLAIGRVYIINLLSCCLDIPLLYQKDIPSFQEINIFTSQHRSVNQKLARA